MKIKDIRYPTALVQLDSGTIVDISMSIIKGSPRIGCELKHIDGGYEVISNTTDPDCVGGVCPIK